MGRAWVALGFLCASWSAGAAAQGEPVCPTSRHASPMSFLHREALFDAIDLDSGWVPGGSALQVRFAVRLAGETEVALAGDLVSTWPESITATAEGAPEGGRLTIDYGLELVARIRFDLEGIRWEGDIPIPGGIPRDLRTAAETLFDPWVLPGADPRPVTAYDETENIRVLNVGLGSIIPIPGVDGGFEVGMSASLRGSYASNRLVITPGEDVIEMEMGSLRWLAPAEGWGPGFDTSMRPEGTIRWEAGVVLRPALYVEVLGSRFDLPIAEIPITVLDLMNDTAFETANARVPLPDLRVEPGTRVAFGSVDVGEESRANLTLHNDGEAPLELTIRAPSAPFSVEGGTFSMPPRSRLSLPVRFQPTDDGARSAMVVLFSNDPDGCTTPILLDGVGVGVEEPDAGSDAAIVADAGVFSPGQPSGCDCRTTGDAAGAWPIALVLALGFRRRRRG
ncbi:MAG: choice-of-anchor D domain-containing protein [Sandaracinus sp.]|nr:choice-of-anchor D domain-containing protein [Sandaracinus sp.]